MPAIDFDVNDDSIKTNNFDPLPPGEYQVVITDSEEKENSKKTGSYMQFTFEVVDGDHKGRKLWSRLNLNNPNDQAVGIARGELKAMCQAVGVMQLKDTAQLHDLPLLVKVIAKPDKETGEVRNEIKGYKAVAKAAPAAKPTPGNAGAPPWKKPPQR